MMRYGIGLFFPARKDPDGGVEMYVGKDRSKSWNQVHKFSVHNIKSSWKNVTEIGRQET